MVKIAFNSALAQKALGKDVPVAVKVSGTVSTADLFQSGVWPVSPELQLRITAA